MKTLRNVLLTLLIVLGLAYAYGASLPRAHRASASIALKQSPQAVYALISAVEDYPRWRTDVQAARLEAVPGALPQGVEEVEHWGAVRYEITEQQAPARWVTRIVDQDQGWGGSWTYDIAATADGASLRITEDGFIDSPWFRLLATHVFGLDHPLKQYLKDVARHFGETATPGA